jgi:dihydrofolate reductase
MKLTLIAAVSDDGFISAGTGVPWHLPADIAHFRKFTEAAHLLVGGRTYSEMIGWFKPEHTVYVIGRENGQPGARYFPTLTAALQMAEGETDHLIVIGGATVYEAAFPLADELVITHVHTRLGEGKAFPLIGKDWQVKTTFFHPADDFHAHSFTVKTYTTSKLRGQPGETINSAH